MNVRAKLHATGAKLRRIAVSGDGVGKAPIDKEAYRPTLDEIVEHPGKLGIHPGTVGILVIDVDPKKGGELPSLIDEVTRAYGDPIRQIDTPGIGNGKFRGVHMLYKKADRPVNRATWLHGDIRADIGYAVMHNERLWLAAIKLAPREKAIDIDRLANAKAVGHLKEASTKEEILAVLRTVEEGRHPAMMSAASKLQSRDCLSVQVIDELHAIWLDMGKPDRASDDEFPRIIEFAKKTEIRISRLVYQTADTLKPERTRWLWARWIPLRAISFIAGVEGLGKSTYALHLAARLTRGQLAGEYFGKPVNVSLYTTEDDPHSIIVPRLMAAGADMKRVAFIKGKPKGETTTPLSIEHDIALLQSHILERDAKALILDPIVTRLDENRDSNKYGDVMKVLEVLGQLFKENNAACIGVTHFNKSTGPVENRVMGSRAWRASIRSLICVHRAEDNENERIVTHSKCNYGPSHESLRFGFRNATVGTDPEDHSDVIASEIVELGSSDVSDGEAVAAMDSRHLKKAESTLDKCAAWLRSFFEDNDEAQVLREDVLSAAKKDGFNKRTVDRAAGEIVGIERTKQGQRALWSLPAVDPTLEF